MVPSILYSSFCTPPRVHHSRTPPLHFFMVLLLDIGNTNTHLGLADSKRVIKQANIPTATWLRGAAKGPLVKFVSRARMQGAALCSVVPSATPAAIKAVERLWGLRPLVLSHKTLRGVGIDYAKPESIGPDRLANAVA